METENRKTRRYGGRGQHHWYALLFLMRTLAAVLKLTGQHERGVRNAWDITVRGIHGRSSPTSRGDGASTAGPGRTGAWWA